MQTSNIPSARISIPFANSGTKNTIPNASQIGVTPGAASYTDGFPPLTFTPLAAGGIPPFGADFNGVLNAISAWIRWFTAFSPSAPYDSTYSTSIGGYPKGALIPKATFDGFWQNMVENNTTNPDAAGANWIDGTTGRLMGTQLFTANGTYTPTLGTKSIIVEIVGGGGGGGGCPACSASQQATASGGVSGGYGKGRYTVPSSPVSVIVGAGGTGGAAGSNAGVGGGASGLGALLTVPGGTGGAAGTASAATVQAPKATNDTTLPTGATLIGLPGQRNRKAQIVLGITAQVILGGDGGCTPFGVGGDGGQGSAGSAGQGFGAGGGGCSQFASEAGDKGGNGSQGMVLIYEYA